MTAMYDPQCECPDCSEERERRALKQKQPTLDLEKLAEETWGKVLTAGLTDTPWHIILSALHKAVQGMNEKIALKCEIAVAERTLDWLKCRKVLDDEIARLTAENTQMREALNFIQNNLLAWNEVVRDDTMSDSAIRGAACIRIAGLHEIAHAALAEKAEPPKAP